MVALAYWILLLKFVTKALKKTTRKFTKSFSSRIISEQATFFRHLVRKVKNIDEDKDMTSALNVTPSQHNMIDLMKEVEGALSGQDKDGQPVRARSISQEYRPAKFNKRFPNGNHAHRLLSESDGDNGSGYTAVSYNTEATEDEESDLPLSLQELLSVHVEIKSDNVNVMKNIITQVAKEDEGLPETDITPEEVTLPLRDVLNLVTLISTIEDQMNNEGENNLTPAESMWSVLTKDNPRDSLPLLKDMFLNGRPRLHQLRE
ncbi:unnamed protein product [Meganyctiphanes norvegica]|uniref:Uncharacterized protein n=1 Tax=Meganyctiphanes norvegica TaxID=48144 RepID=A0AAV2PYA1_MEGNR